MLDFLRRIPEMLGLKRRSEAKAGPAAKAAAPKPAESNVKPLRGRGTGRGLTPPSKPKSSANQRRGKR